MSDLPKPVHIYDQGPREGFQFAGHSLPGRVMREWTPRALREKARAAA